MVDTDSNKTSVNSSLAKGLNIIDILSQSSKPCSISEIAKHFNYSIPTTHRILYQLVELGVLQKVNNKSFIISASHYKTSLNVIKNSELMLQMHYILEQLSEVVQETCNLTNYDNGKAIYFDRVEYKWPHRITLPVGSKLPLYCTASGKLILAYLEKKYQKIALMNLKPLTTNTITEPEELKQNLKQIVQNQYSLDKEEYMIGMDALALPVFINNRKMPLFVLSVHAPVTRKNHEKLLSYLPQLREAANRLSELLNEVTGS